MKCCFCNDALLIHFCVHLLLEAEQKDDVVFECCKISQPAIVAIIRHSITDVLWYGVEEKHVEQRGPDRKPRVFNPKSLSNLKQFQKPVSEASLSVNPAVNSGINWSKLGKTAVIVIVFSVIIWKLHQRKKISYNEAIKSNYNNLNQSQVNS